MPSLSLGRPLYRAGQFFAALRPRVDAAARAEAAAALDEKLFALFDSMSPRDQRHCLDVYLALREDGCRDRDVLTAALLHDAGKGRLAGARIRLWHRVAYVVLATALPRRLETLATGDGAFDRVRAGLAVLHHHSERGAELAAAMGAPTAAVDLIRRHESRETGDDRLRLLQAADDGC